MKKAISYNEYESMFPEKDKLERQIDYMIKNDLWDAWDCIWTPGVTNEELGIIVEKIHDLENYLYSIREKALEACGEDEKGDCVILIDTEETDR